MWFARFQILICEPQSIWRKLLVLSWLYVYWQKNKLTKLCFLFFFTLASSSSSILERSRSSGRLVPAVQPLPTSEAGQLKRTSAASTSALSRSSAGAPPSPTTPCTTQPTSSTPAAAATTAAASAGSTSSILSTQNPEQNGCSSVGNNRTEDQPSEQTTIGYVIHLYTLDMQ